MRVRRNDDGTATVRLGYNDLLAASVIGGQRHSDAVAEGRRDNHGFDRSKRDGNDTHAFGAMGEMCVGAVTGVEWHGGVNTFKNADLGLNVQVKTRTSHGYELFIRKDDNRQHAYVLVTGTEPEFKVWGWAWGHEIDANGRDDTFGNGREVVKVLRHDQLRPMSTLVVERNDKE